MSTPQTASSVDGPHTHVPATDGSRPGRPPSPAGRLRATWGNLGCLVPVVGPLGLIALVRLGQQSVTAANRADTYTVLEPLRREIARAPFHPKGSVFAAADLEARFAWEPMFLVFVVVAVGVVCFCARLLWDVVREHPAPSAGPLADPPSNRQRLKFAAALLGGVVIAMGAFRLTGAAPELMRDTILDPVLSRTLAKEGHALSMVDRVLSIFAHLTFVAAILVTAAAGAALWLPRFEGSPEVDPAQLRAHLALQWRRLHHVLYAGALLLVAAVLQQATIYGWAPALTRGSADAHREEKAARVTQAAVVASRLHLAQGLLAADSIARQPLPADAAEARRLDSAIAAGRVRVAQAAAESARAHARLRGDTVALNHRIAVLTGLAERMDRAGAAMMQRSIGLVYTLLLAVLYVPAALLLMGRARALAAIEVDGGSTAPAADRDAWLTRHGLAFSLANHWGKALTVLSPWLTAGPAAFLSQYLSG